MPESRFQFELRGVARELEDGGLRVPIYQRDYAWGGEQGRDEVGEFWRDLHGVFASPAAEYFLGTIVLSRTTADDVTTGTVIDGQQRLATTAILLAAIRDELHARGDDERAKYCHDTYLAKFDPRTGGEEPQLRLNADDNGYFQHRIVAGESDAEPENVSHKLIDRAYTFLRQKVAATADDAGPTWAQRLTGWMFFLRERARVIVVSVPNEADAFLIYETLNDRGADLTIADLLKNYLFGKSADNLDSVRNAWVATMTHLEVPAVGGKLFTDFLRHFWSSKHGATRERDLYRKIKDRITSSVHVSDFAAELSRASRQYAALMNSEHEIWDDQDYDTKRHIDTLLTLNLEQMRPLLLAVMQHFAPGEFARAMRSLVSWAVRGLIVGGIGGGVTERYYCSAAVEVRSGEIKSTEELLSSLSDIVPSDDEFESHFATARVSRGPLARYYLHALERFVLGESEPELVPNEDKDKVNLEHVLPKNPAESDWPQFSEDERIAFVHRLGNLTLLTKGGNDRIGNAPFDAKKPILAASNLHWTKEAGEQAQWTPDVVAERQYRMAAVAPKVWPREPD